MKTKLFLIFIAVILIFGCAKPPTVEMDKAKEAVFKAENDENAVIYAGNTLQRAQDALRKMQIEADSKRYDAAKNYAAEAITAAERAIADGKASADRAKAEAAAMIPGLKTDLDEAGRNINGARYSSLDLDYDKLNNEYDGASDKLEKAEDDNSKGLYNDALSKGRDVRASISVINNQISDAASLASHKK